MASSPPSPSTSRTMSRLRMVLPHFPSMDTPCRHRRGFLFWLANYARSWHRAGGPPPEGLGSRGPASDGTRLCPRGRGATSTVGEAGPLYWTPSPPAHQPSHTEDEAEDDVDQYLASTLLDEPSQLQEALLRAEEARDGALSKVAEARAVMGEESVEQRSVSDQAQVWGFEYCPSRAEWARA